MDDWRQHHANESEKAFSHDLVQGYLDELLRNLGADRKGLVFYGICKVASAAAQVARAQALGFDPDLLRLGRHEANEEIWKVAEAAARRGVPVWTINPEDAS
jgi:hypothetical protein